jgi:hypothetical protein
MLNVIYAECHYAKWNYAECPGATKEVFVKRLFKKIGIGKKLFSEQGCLLPKIPQGSEL